MTVCLTRNNFFHAQRTSDFKISKKKAKRFFVIFVYDKYLTYGDPSAVICRVLKSDI